MSQEIFAGPGSGHSDHCCRFQFLFCTVWSIVAKVTSDKDGTGDANALGCRVKGAREFRCKHGHREVKLFRALAVHSRKLGQKTLVNLQQQVNRAFRVPIWKVSCKVNRKKKKNRQVDSSRLQALFLFLSSSIISREWDSGVHNPFLLPWMKKEALGLKDKFPLHRSDNQIRKSVVWAIIFLCRSQFRLAWTHLAFLFFLKNRKRKRKKENNEIARGFFFFLEVREGIMRTDSVCAAKPASRINRTARLCDGGYKVADKRGEPHTEWL